jgi:hypothetical protein
MPNPVRITCNSTDISGFVDWKSIDFVAQLTKDVGTGRFSVLQNAANLSAITVPVVGDTINLYDSTGLIWAGTVTETEATIEGLVLTWQISVTDWGYLLDGTLVRKNYSQLDPHAIVLDIVRQADPLGTKGFTTNHVQFGNFLIPSVKFNYQQPSKALQSLANLIGWDWYIDPSKDIHFFLGDIDDGEGEGGIAPVFINTNGGYTGADVWWNSLDIDQNLTNMQNSVYVIGGTYPKTFTAANTPDTFLTDGVRQFFSVSYPYYSPTAVDFEAVPINVTLDGTPQTVGKANQDDPAGFQVMYNDQQRWIQFTGGAPSGGQTIKVFGTAKVPIIAHASDSSSIATYGEYQGIITDTKILSVPEAQARAKAQILQFGHPVWDVKFNTLVPGCKVGQAVNFDLPAFGIADTLIIKRIEAVGYAPGEEGMLEYQIECIGSDVITFTDLMQSILQQEATQTQVDDSTVNENLESFSEDAVTTETVNAPIATSMPYQLGVAVSNQFRMGFSRLS